MDNADKSVYIGRMMNHKATPKRKSARERILETASRLFYRDGIRATGIDRVIAEAEVTKVTLYRHFPSKNDLILEFLERRHRQWISWFKGRIALHGETLVESIIATLEEWFREKNFRGCAFINGVAEIGASVPGSIELARRHKEEMTSIIATLLPPSKNRALKATMVSIALDGTIVRAQIAGKPDMALEAFKRFLKTI